jgi:hypothetical protein
MSTTCNLIQQVKVSDLLRYNTLTAKDLILTIESGSSNDLYSRKSTFGDIVTFLKSVTGSYTGSFSGSAKTLSGKFTGSFTGSFKGKHSGSFSGNFNGSNTGSFTGSFKGSTTGKSKTSGSLSGSFSGYILTKKANASGSFSGSLYGTIISKNSKLTGSFNGTSRGRFSGSVSASIQGYISASNHYNVNRKVAFYGTASCAKTASYALNSGGNITGTGTTNQFSYWSGTSALGSTNYIVRNSTINNLGSMPAGRITVNNPLQFSAVGEQIIQNSSSGQSISGLGLQTSNNYLRAAANFAIYYSGSHVNTSALPGRDVIWQSGKSGWGVLGVRQRLLSIGNIVSSDNVNAQLHLHLSGSTGWPTGYNPNSNVFLITSGSSQTKLLRVSGSGQLDVRGDIVALSTFASSDIRLKDNIKPIENALSKVNQINPIEFNWKSNGKQDFGVSAQQIEELYPDLVTENIEGYKVVKYNPLIALLLKSIQELHKEVQELKNNIES